MIAQPAVSRSGSRAALTVRPQLATVRAQHRQLNVAAQATLAPGGKLSDFPNYYKVLKNQDGDAVTLSSFQNKSSVVLFFYPKAGTPGCTTEVCAFRDSYERFVKAGAVVFGISNDPPEANKAFKAAQGAPYDLLTDANDILRKEFGIQNEMFILPGRQTYVIDKSGTCIMSFNDMLNANKHVSEALQALNA